MPKEKPKEEKPPEPEKNDSEEKEASNDGTIDTESDKLQELASKPLPFLDYSKISPDSFVLVLGKRRYGKSIWTRHLLSQMAHFFQRGGYVFTHTKHNWFWQQHFPDNRIYKGFQRDVLAKILQDQMTLYKMVIHGIVELDQSPFVCIILDDIASDKDLKFDDLLMELLFMGRHYWVFVMMCSQDMKTCIGPSHRGNADLVAMTFQTQKRNLESLADDYAAILDDRKGLEQLILKSTMDFHMLVVDQTTAKYDASDMFFQDLADPDPPPFKIGSEKFWKEAGNSWEYQLQVYQNVPQLDREGWEKLTEEDDDEETQNPYNDTYMDRPPTGLLQFADPDTRMMIEGEKDRLYGKGHWNGAKGKVGEMWRNWRYAPPKNVYQNDPYLMARSKYGG